MIDKVHNIVTRFRGASNAETAPEPGTTRTLVLPEPEIESDSDETPVKKSAPGDFSDLPTDYKEICKRLHGRTEPFTAEERELQRRLHVMNQMPPAPEIDGNKLRAERGRHISSAEEKRLARISELEAAIAKGEWLPISPSRSIPEPYLNYLSTYEALFQIKAMRPALATYELEVLKSFIFHSPNMRREEVKHMLASRPSADVRKAILDEEKLLSSKHFRQIAGQSRADLFTRFDETVKPQVVQFLKLARGFVDELKQDAIAIEKSMFADFGVVSKYQPTAISKQFDQYLEELQHAIDRIVNPAPSVLHLNSDVPHSETDIQRLFAIPILPQSIG